MKANTKKWASVLLAAALAFSLAACSTTPAATTAAPTTSESAATGNSPVYGGKLVSYHSEFYNDYDPNASTMKNYVSFFTDMLWNIDWETDRSKFDFSTSYIDANYISGQLASEWTIADDLKSMTVKINENVYFQDKTSAGLDAKYNIYKGRQLKASDVKYTYDRLLGLDGVAQQALEMTNWPGTLSMVESVEATDDFTVKFNFKTSDQLSIDSFMCAFVSICGPEWDALTAEQKSDWHYAAGTGPFILTDYSGDNSMTFTKNAKYWAKDAAGNALPYLDQVQLVYMTDAATVLSSFMSGDLDVVVANSEILNKDQADQLKASLKADQYASYSYYGKPIGVGIKQGNNPVPALADIKVREAMQYAIDVKAISEYFGYTYDSTNQMICGVFANGTAWNNLENWGNDLVASYTTYDVEKAKQLLAEAGYADGFAFDVTIFERMPVEAFQLAAEYLSKVGITMNVSVVTSPNEMSAIGGDANNPGSQFGSYGIDNMQFFGMAIPYDGPMNAIKQNEAQIDTMAQTVLAATNAADQTAAAQAFDKEFMSQHYLMMITYSEVATNWYNSSVKGLAGEKPCQNYYFGYMYARTWLAQ